MARRQHATRHPEPEDDTPVLLELFREIADRWELPVEARLALLGGISRTTHYEWTRKAPPRSLTPDQRDRIAHVIGIDVATQAFYGPGSENARTHIHRPHTAPNGEGTALAVMMSGLPGLAAVRQHLELLGGGSVVASTADAAGAPR
jgi:uncharacterized protein (DUF2384 family)